MGPADAERRLVTVAKQKRSGVQDPEGRVVTRSMAWDW